MKREDRGSLYNSFVFGLLSFLLLLTIAKVNCTGGSYTNDDGSWSAHWVVDENVTRINYTLICPQARWCAIGISNTTGMPNTDVYWATIGTGCTNGCYSDRYAYTTGQPTLDNHTDLYPISASLVNGTFTWSFWRYLQTGDLIQDIPITSAGNWLLWAWSSKSGTPTGTGDYSFPYHNSNRGEIYLSFLDNISPSTSHTQTPTTTPSPSFGAAISNSPSPSRSPNSNSDSGSPINSTLSYTEPDQNWYTSWEFDEENINFTVVCKTSGWCALGINPGSESMAGTAIYWATPPNSASCPNGCFSNRFATGFFQPGQLSPQVITPISAQLVDGIFTWKFSRPITISGNQKKRIDDTTSNK